MMYCSILKKKKCESTRKAVVFWFLPQSIDYNDGGGGGGGEGISRQLKKNKKNNNNKTNIN